MDTVLLGWLVTASVAGKYQVGIKLTMPAVFISGLISTGLMGRISNLESRERDWSDDLWNSLSYGSLLSVPIFFGSLVIGEELAVLVFGNQYSGAGIFVVGLALYRLIETQMSPLKSVIGGLNRPDITFRISSVTFLINVILGVGLWWIMGSVGIIAATVLASGVSYILTVISIRRITDIDFILTTPFLKQILSGTIMAVVVYAFKSLFGIPTQITIIGYLAIGGLVYMGLQVTLSPHLRTTAIGIWEDFQNKYV
jgi:O-antigen/teichoic acid export membrane protein